MSRREPRPARLPAIADTREAEIKQYALDWLRAARGGEGDPFGDAAPHEVIQHMLRDLADADERNAAFVLRMAIEGFEDAHEALAELISERNVRGEALGMALGTYVNMLTHSGPPRVRLAEGRRRENFVADLGILFLLLDLMARFDLKLRRSSSRRPSACSIVADVLRDAGIWAWGSEERVRKIWERYGPPAIPTYRQPPAAGVVRFTSH